jgi:hypothetical protein
MRMVFELLCAYAIISSAVMWISARKNPRSVPALLPIKEHLGTWLTALVAGLVGAIGFFVLLSLTGRLG